MNLKPRLSSQGKVTSTDRGWLLSIPAGPANRYRLSQLDDHLGIARKDYPCKPPMAVQLEARVSSNVIPGTWGFGIWNDPYGFSVGPGGGLLRLPALPNAAWYFCSSPASYLSFRDDKPANGLLAQLFASPRFDPLLLRAVLTFPFSRKAARRLLSRIIDEDSSRLTPVASAPPATGASLDVTQWHRYSLEWTTSETRFQVDDVSVLESPLSPRPPLGLVIWIDNQRAAFDPQGRVSYGLERDPEPAWLELRDFEIG